MGELITIGLVIVAAVSVIGAVYFYTELKKVKSSVRDSNNLDTLMHEIMETVFKNRK